MVKKIGKYVVSFKKWKSTGNIRVMVKYEGREKYAIYFFARPEKLDQTLLGKEIEIDQEINIDIDEEVKRKIELSIWFINAFLGKSLFAEVIDIRALSKPLKKRIEWEKNIGTIILPKSVVLLKKIGKNKYLIFVIPRTIDSSELMKKILNTPEKILKRTWEIFLRYFEVYKKEIEEHFPICYHAINTVRKNMYIVSSLIN